MSDTVSAAASRAEDTVGLTFLPQDSLPPGATFGFVHVSGGSQDASTSPDLIFQFVTLTADFKGLVPVPELSSETPTTPGSSVTIPAGAQTTIVTFDHSQTVVVPGDR
jgi:hypothetical protein